MRSGSPALTENTFRKTGRTTDNPMTLPGTVGKTGILLVILTFTAAWVWTIVY